MPSSSVPYRGRFAPSPTGPLHFGSLVGALCSYLDARQHQGEWLLRIEDIDPLREQPGAGDKILQSLEAHHLFWDRQVSYQSQHQARYEYILAQLLAQRFVYFCPCSRRQLQERQGRHLLACEQRLVNQASGLALRFAVTEGCHYFADTFQGDITYTLHPGTDDFVLKRKEGFYAYQLAVVSDDIAQQITHVVRGIDLIESTPLQLQLYQAIGAAPPQFGHFPVVVTQDGQKLSKQRLSPALDDRTVMRNLRLAAQALQLLSQQEPCPEQPDTLLELLVQRWSIRHLAGVKALPAPAEEVV